MDTMQGLKRTHYCGDVEGIGNEVVVGGLCTKSKRFGKSYFYRFKGQNRYSSACF